MRKFSTIILGACCSASLLTTGCIDETFPTDVASEEQVTSSSKATEAIMWAMPAFMNKYNIFEDANGSAYGFDYGYSSLMHVRDVMTGDMPIVSHSYDHYSSWEQNRAIGPNYLTTQYIWNYYWKLVQTTNMTINTTKDSTDPTLQGYLGAGYAFRAMVYLDLARMFEFLPNDIYTDGTNSSGNNVKNLTVPIVTDGITEEEARNNPRVSREDMYEFILSDLNNAEQNIIHLNRAAKTLPDLSVVYGLKARLYMWVENYPEAKNYARKAINAASGCTPLTKEQALSTTSGFNDLSVSSWMWGMQFVAEDEAVQTEILNWTSWASNEAVFGYAAAGPMSMIDKSLYDKIADTDFRKLMWKAPEGSELRAQNTYIDAAQFAKIPDYGSLKFRPAQGNSTTPSVGAASAYPVMRVEEMYLIEAEAAAHSNATEGARLLNGFMQTYRDENYNCKLTTTDAVVEEIVLQKRIELWGEGQSFFDIKRLDMSVTRGYEGTNFGDAARFNTKGRPAWMNICIVRTEENNNSALKGYENPDPSDKYTPWTGK